MKQQLHAAIKTIIAILFIHLATNSTVFAQLHGTYTIDNTLAASATNYKNFTSAAGDLNSGTRTDGGPANGPGATANVTFNVAAGETFSEAPVTITYTNPSWYTITFENSGTPGTNNPTLQGTIGVGDSDAVIKLLGGSYYVFNGINFSDNQSNTTPTTEMEYGIYLSALTASGCQYNTFENGTITLNKTNTNLPVGVYTNSDGSAAIGANSYNAFTNLTVQDVITGYSLNGSENTGASEDYGNVINAADGGRSEITNVGTTASNNGTVTEGIYYNGENTLTISNTSINGLTYYNTSSAGTVYGIVSGSGGIGIPTGTVTLNADTLQSLRVQGGSPSTATIEGIYLGSVTTTTNITNCQMQAFLSTGSGASVYGIDIEAGVTTTTTINISGNTMNNFINLDGDILGFNTGPVSGSTNYLNIFNNTLSNFTCNTGASTVYGVQLSSQSLSFHNNKMSSFSGGTGDALAGVGVIGLYLVAPTGNLTQFHDDTLTGFTAPTSITGLEESLFTASSIAIYNCVFSNFSTTSLSTGSITGLTASVTSDTVYDNHVYTFSTPATDGKIIGIIVSGAPGVGTPDIVYNNMVYDLQANNSTISTNGGAVVGIQLPNVDNAGAAVELYDNTVFLNGTAAVAGQYSSALYVRALVGAVTGGYDIRNNILVNDYGVADANDHAVAMWYNNLNVNFQGIATTTNNNLLYAGTPSAGNLIFYCKGSDSVQTLAAYKTLLGGVKEAASVTENPPFVSVTSPIDVHIISDSIYTQAESGGQVITSPAINTDIDGNIRAGSVGYTGCGTAPDIGASEFCGIPDTAFAIAWPVSVEQGQTGVAFSVSPIADAMSYNWSLPTGATITSGDNTDSITVSFSGLSTGTDTISIFASNCCGNGVGYKSALMIATGVNQLPVNSDQLSIYPNPAANQLTISNQLPINRIEITNELGQVMFVSSDDLGTKQTIDVSTLAMGIYFVSVTSNNETVTRKISVVR